MLATGTSSDYGSQLEYATTSTGSWTALGILFEFGNFEFMMDALQATSHGSGGKEENIPSGLMKYSEIPVTVHASEANVNWAWDTMEDKTVYWFRKTYGDSNVTAKVFQAVVTKGSIPSVVAESPKVFKLQFTLKPAGDITGIGA